LTWKDSLGQSNERIELTEIEFNGNNSFDDKELEDIIISKESPGWVSQFLDSFTSFGNPANYFDSLNIRDDIAILNNFYKANGYFKANITATYSIEKNGSNEASLIFNIVENNPSYLRNYNLNGLNILPPDLYSILLNRIDTDTTNIYSEKLLEINNGLIVSYLQDKGYMLIESSSPTVEVDTLLNLVDITTDFNLGNRYRISGVKVEKSGPGKDLVNENLIEEIANITPENYYSYNALKLAQIRLYRTNLFSSAVITGNVADTNRNYVPVNIITNVGLLNELSPEIIGINEENIFKLGLGLTYSNKNFLGGARKLTIGTSAAAQNITEFIKEASLTSSNIFGFADARISIEQPFLFGKPINTLLETFYTLEKKKNQWNANIYGAKLNLNFELPPYIYLTALSTYLTWQNSEYIFQEDYLYDRLDTLWSGGTLTTNSTSAILGVQLVANKTDDLLFPTEGYSLTILAEDGNALPYIFSKIGNYNFGQTAYYKIVLTSTFYFPYFKNIFDVFGTKFKIGNIQEYHGNLKDIPPNQRLTAGGSNSIRGWTANDLPLIESVTLTEFPTQAEIENIARNITPGGFFLLEGSIEGREFLSEKIGVALFIDYGNVWNDYREFRYDELAVAAGFGFRYYSDFAPIRLDFGFKAYDPYDRRSFFTRLKHSPFLDNLEFQIGIGEAF
jgi:outer membrane protein assembly factor BamA